MNKEIVLAFAAGAAATSLGSQRVVPDVHVATSTAIVDSSSLHVTTEKSHTIVSQGSSTERAPYLEFPDVPTEWSKSLEREFRHLAVEEACGNLSPIQNGRLRQLDFLRGQLVCPRTVDEVLFQMRRDRLLDKMEQNLREYVEFKRAHQ